MPEFETREADWLSFEEALKRVSAIRPLEWTHEPLASSAGLAIAEDVTSELTLPPGPTSHMDGYAICLGDRGVGDGGLEPIPVVGVSRPGSPWSGPLPVGAAVRIMTGALLPERADTVVPVEETDRESSHEGEVRIVDGESMRAGTGQGRYVRPAGEELERGERLAEAGDTLTPALLALLAATGEPDAPVHRAPRVATLVTGDELVPTGDPSALSGGVYRADILSPSLPHFIRLAGGLPLPPERVGDDRSSLEGAVARAAEVSDFVITTGGASMGEADLVKRVLDDLGYRQDFWRVLMRPGSPVSWGWLPSQSGEREVPVLGLPGNPVSAWVTFLTLGCPALRSLGGHRRGSLPKLLATTRVRLSGPARLTRFFRVQLDPEEGGGSGARLPAEQGSGVIRSMAVADGLATVPAGREALEEGDPVEVLLLPKLGWGSDA